MTYRVPSKLFAFGAALLLATATLVNVSSGEPQINEFPAVISTVAPSIPLTAVALRLRGNVVVELTLDSGGTPISAHAVTGHPLLLEPTKQAALQWKFVTATETTRKVRLVFVYPVLARGTLTSITVLPYRLELDLTVPALPLVRSPETESQIPTDWRPGKDRCSIHAEVLRKDRVDIVYGLVAFRKGYHAAHKRLFKNSNTAVYGGCVIMTDAVTGEVSPKFADVLYCGKCRIDQKKWSYRNRHKKFSA